MRKAESATGGVGLREVVRSSGIYSIAMVLNRVVGVLLLPLYTHYLTPADYGILELLDLTGVVVALLMGNRLGQAIFYYYFASDDKETRSGYLSTGLLSSVFLGIIAALIGQLLSEPISRLVLGTAEYENFVRIFFLGLAGSLPTEFGYCCLRVRDRAGTQATLSVINTIGMVTLNIVFLVVLHMGVAAVLWSRVIAMSATAVALCVIVFSSVPVRFNWKQFLDLARYSLPLIVSSGAYLILHFGDRFFLRPSVSLSLLGLYAVAYKLGMVVANVSAPFFTYWNSQMVGIVKGPGGEKLYCRVATYLVFALTCVALLLALFVRPVVHVLTTPDYYGAIPLVPWLAMAYVIRGIGTYCSNTFLLIKRPGWDARVTLLGAAAALASYTVLIPIWKLWGAVASTLIGFTVMFVAALWKSQRVRPFAYEFGRWVKILGSAVVTVVLFFLVCPEGFWVELLTGFAFCGVFAVLLLAVRVFHQDEKDSVLQLLAGMRQRLAAGISFRA